MHHNQIMAMKWIVHKDESVMRLPSIVRIKGHFT